MGDGKHQTTVRSLLRSIHPIGGAGGFSEQFGSRHKADPNRPDSHLQRPAETAVDPRTLLKENEIHGMRPTRSQCFFIAV